MFKVFKPCWWSVESPNVNWFNFVQNLNCLAFIINTKGRTVLQTCFSCVDFSDKFLFSPLRLILQRVESHSVYVIFRAWWGEDWYSNMCAQFHVIGMYKASVHGFGHMHSFINFLKRTYFPGFERTPWFSMKSMQVFVPEASILILLVGETEHHVNKIMTV